MSDHEDKLPPHSVEAERSLLGCVLFDQGGANECVKMIAERVGADRVFFDERHHTVWEVFAALYREGIALDMITVRQRLLDNERLEQVGGAGYLTELVDSVPSAVNLPDYLAIVWEKFLARSLLATASRIAMEVQESNGVTEVMLSRVKRLQEEFEHKSQRGTVTHQYLKCAADFEAGFFGKFFGGLKGPPGWALPIKFVLKIRRQETTLVSGDDGAGKSTLLAYFVLHLAAQLPPGEKVCIASLETQPQVTMWMLASMLLGKNHLPDSAQGRQAAALALAWINSRFIFYDFVGIAVWQDLLMAFRYAKEHMGMAIGIIDSVMRVGIVDDDYGQQGLAAAAFAQFAKDTNTHLFDLIHENKSGQSGKASIRGSKLWTANADNVLRIQRNVEKGEEVGKLEWRLANERAQRQPNQAEINSMEGELAKLRCQWDTRMVLQKQRYPGTDQNAAKAFWFDKGSFQFRDHPMDGPVNWLEQWNSARTKVVEEGKKLTGEDRF